MAEVPVQTASSLGVGSVRNSDGTITIRCRLCGNQITDVDGRNRFHSAVCIICQYDEKGTPLPEEIEKQLRSMRMPGGNRLPMSAVDPTMLPDPMVGNEKKVGRPDYFFRVIRQAVKAAVAVVAEELPSKKKKVYKEQTAQELANEKRHRPLFEGGVEVNIKKRE